MFNPLKRGKILIYSFDNFDKEIKVKLGFFHLSSCSGCQIAFLDMFEELPDILDTVEIAYSNMLTNRKEIPKLNVAFIEGTFSIGFKHHIKLIKEIKEKADIIVAIGGCAAFGGIRRLNVGAQSPQPSHQASIPITELDYLKGKIKYVIPGCPPNPYFLYKFLLALLELNEEFLRPFEHMVFSTFASGYDILMEVVNKGLCTGCGTCICACPTKALEFSKRTQRPTFNKLLCVGCGSCLAGCPQSFKPYPQPVYG